MRRCYSLADGKGVLYAKVFFAENLTAFPSLMFWPRSSLALSFTSSPFSPPVGSAPPSASFAIPANFSRFFTSSRIPVIVVASSRSASRSFPAAACACVFRSFRRSFNSLTLHFYKIFILHALFSFHNCFDSKIADLLSFSRGCFLCRLLLRIVSVLCNL